MTEVLTASGYAHPQYAASLAAFGTPRLLPRSRGWLLERPISDIGDRDATGCYPLFTCQDWAGLGADLDDVDRQHDLVSVVLVTDPFGEYDDAFLRACFPSTVLAFKEHFVVDLTRPARTFISAHHRRSARKALDLLGVERCDQPASYLSDWLGLYATLVRRHTIRGIAAFSAAAFACQLKIPGMVAFRASYEGTTVGMLLWYVDRGVAYYHLGAYSPSGYDLRASFALFWYALHSFADEGTRWLNLGAGAGTRGDAVSGLTRFKAGWATGTRTAYLCGRIFDPARYDQLTLANGTSDSTYFPAYRLWEPR